MPPSPTLAPVRRDLGSLDDRVADRLGQLDADAVVERIWSKDPTVWRGTRDTPDLGDRLGWLGVVPRSKTLRHEAVALAETVRFRHDAVLLAGMGGASLAPLVLSEVRGRAEGFPTFWMLDSTAPPAVRTILPPEADPFVVLASKSGTTIETQSFFSYFWQARGARPERFAIITDPGSPLDRQARERGIQVFHGEPEIGGRFSALSAFGMVPAALAGVDVVGLATRASAAMEGCRRPVSATNPGAWLGAVLGEAALAGRDKLTLVLSPRLRPLAWWIEQLVAESTGKGGVGILPVTDGGGTPATAMGSDRVVVGLALAEEHRPVAERLEALAAAGHPVVQYDLADTAALGFELFRWEFATAVAAAVLGVNPFDQPNVAESKANTTRGLTGGRRRAPGRRDPVPCSQFEGAVGPRDYVAVLAYLPPTPELDRALADLADRCQQRLGVAVTVGYGPRYLHSTGQLHKGGPPRGHFLQIVPDGFEPDVPIPGAGFTFGQLLRAQAEGDREALEGRRRPVLVFSTLGALDAWLAADGAD